MTTDTISNKQSVSEKTATSIKLRPKLQEGRLSGEQNGWLSEKDIEEHFAEKITSNKMF